MRDAKGRFVKEPRPFKVGDRVEWIFGPCFNGKLQNGATGKVVRVSDAGTVFVDWDAPGGIKNHTLTHERLHEFLRLLEPAPEPKAKGPFSQMVDEAVRRAEHAESALAAKDQEIAELKAKLKTTEQAEELAKFTAASACRRAEEIEAKLEDIRAINRAAILAERHLLTAPGDLIAAILAGAA